MVKGYCRECGKQDDPDKFEQKDSDLLCCSKVTTNTTQWVEVLYSIAGRETAECQTQVPVRGERVRQVRVPGPRQPDRRLRPRGPEVPRPAAQGLHGEPRGEGEDQQAAEGSGGGAGGVLCGENQPGQGSVCLQVRDEVLIMFVCLNYLQ